jgi:MFS family permease
VQPSTTESAPAGRARLFPVLASRIPGGPDAHRASVAADYRRNRTVFAGWEFLWGLGAPFALYSTFAPAYLATLNAPQLLVGLILAFPPLFSATQLLVGYFVRPANRLRIVVLPIMGCMLPLLAYSAAAAVWGETWTAGVHASLYTAAMLVFLGVPCALNSLMWEIITDNTPEDRRGELFGWRAVGAGISGLAVSGVAAWLLQRWDTPLNYRISFTIGSVLYFLSCLILLRMRDHVHPVHLLTEHRPQGSLLAHVVALVHERWRDARYRSFMFFYTLLVVASTNAPFMVAGARAELGASARELGLFVPLYLVALTVSGPLLGRLADRCGFRLVGVVCGLLLTSSFLLCLVSDSLRVWYVAFTLYAACPFAAAAVLANLSAELCPGVPASRLIAVGNVMVIGFVVAGSALCGAVIDATGSYPAIFTANLVLAIVATAGFLFVVREPRSPTPSANVPGAAPTQGRALPEGSDSSGS